VASAPHPVQVRPGAAARVRLALEPMARVSGRVVDAAGDPVGGARVSPRELPGADQISTRFTVGVTAPEIVATTDAAGAFALFVPAGTGRASLAASAPGHAPGAGAAFEVEPGGVRGRVLLRLARGRSLRGLVRDARGRPVAGAAVTASALRPVAAGIAGEPPDAATGAGGRFRLTGLGPGPHLVEVRSPRHVAATVRVPPGRRRVAPIALRRSAPGTGGGVARRGVPLRAASVIASARRGRYEGRAETDGSGRFALLGLPAGVRATVDVLADGCDPASTTTARAPAAGVRVLVRPAAGLPGRVVDAATGRPLTAFRVHFLGGSTGAGGLTALPDERAFASADGAFRWLDLPSGRWSFAAAAPGYRPTVRRGLPTSASARRPAVFALRPGTALAGRAVDARSRRPLANAIVSARPARGPAPPAIAATDAAGRFRLDGLAPGRLVVSLREPSHRDRSVAVSVPRRGALELTVEPR
ncbi:MAG TPA: carboxypeptidase-like regulatory domain-containing protein, partial [Solirubrobacteraceae bacterium]|nr:carboxypeptidase-like regulatory domain-containing protein [Solirubrobacteraceae bacterium]